MAGRLPCLACIASVAFLVGRPAWGQFEYRLGAGSSIGVSDNPASQSSSTTQSQAAVLLAARGHVDLGYLGQLSSERMAYGIAATTWTGNSQRTTVTHTLTLASDLQPSPALKIGLQAGGTLTRLSVLDTVAATDPATAGPRPTSDQQYLNITASELLAWMMTGSWSLNQAINARLYRPLGDTTSGSRENKTADFDLGVTRAFQRDAVGVQTVVGVISSSVPASGQTPAVSATSEYGQAQLNWRHDWTSELSHSLAGGLFFVRTDEVKVLPAGSASLAWRSLGREAELRAARSATTSTYAGVVYVRDILSLRVALPIDQRERLRFTSAGNLERASSAGTSSGLSGSTRIVSINASLRWKPGDTFSYALDYSFRDQKASADSSGFASYRRQTVLFTVEMGYPPSYR